MLDRGQNLSRPNFFPGQWIDYRDLNRLSEQPERTLSFLCSHLFEGGGIVVNALEEFRLVPTQGLEVVVKPGVAFLPTGQPIVSKVDMAVDLAAYLTGPEPITLVVSLQRVEKGTDPFTDPEDPAVQGYRSQTTEPQLVVSTSAPKHAAVELFRVTLSNTAKVVRMPAVEEEWDLTTSEKGVALLDLRYRTHIVPQTYRPTSPKQLLAVRDVLYKVESHIRKVGKIFLMEDGFHSSYYLTQLHAELLQLPMQPVKIAYLIAEFSSKLSLYLEALGQHVGSEKNNFQREIHLQILALLDRFKVKRVLPRTLPLDSLLQLGALLQQFVSFAEERFSLLNTVEEALLELRHRTLDFAQQISLAGTVFQQVDKVLTVDSERLHLMAPENHVRNVQTKYKNGDTLALKGCFFKAGSLGVDIKVPHPDRPVVLIARQYVRRGDSQLRYELNGKHLVNENWNNLDLENNWMNRGFVLSPEMLASQTNRLGIFVEQTDLDFGFFDLHVYQPVVFKGDYL
jgi:hypothetical protein